MTPYRILTCIICLCMSACGNTDNITGSEEEETNTGEEVIAGEALMNDDIMMGVTLNHLSGKKRPTR